MFVMHFFANLIEVMHRVWPCMNLCNVVIEHLLVFLLLDEETITYPWDTAPCGAVAVEVEGDQEDNT